MKAKLSNSQRLYFLRSTAHFFTHLFVWLSIALLSACAPGSMGYSGKQYYYEFYYNAIRDMKDIQILGCEYKTAKQDQQLHCGSFGGKIFQRTGETHLLAKPSSLYVKWNDLSSNNIYEATADLKASFPNDLDFKNLSVLAFDCERDILNVFLVSNERRPPYWPIQGPHSYQRQTGKPHYLFELKKVYTIASVKGAPIHE